MLSVHDAGLWPPAPNPFNMAAHVLTHADRLADKVALSVVTPASAQDWTYAELAGAVRGTATGLLNLGLVPGDRVLMRLGNSVDFPVVFLACLTAGLIPVPTSSQLTGPEVTKIAAEIAPALTVAAPGIALAAGNGRVLMSDALAGFRTLPPADFAMGDPDRPAYIIYTSGTSGKPRAVVHAHRAIWARGMMHQGWYGLTGEDHLMHAGAFNWTYTLGTGLMDPWSVGAAALIPGEGVMPADLPGLLAAHRATIFAAAPGVFRQMLRVDMPPLPALRHGLSAGEKLPAVIRAAWVEATGTPILEAYGMSECSTFVSAAPDRPAPEGSLGYPQPGRRVAVIGPDGPVARGAAGVLGVHRGDPGLMLGYLDQPEDTRARYQGDWFLTGDMVSMAEEDAITYLGRDDDMMNAGGYRVSPIEVEGALNAHPDIHESAAVEIAVKSDVTVIAAFYVAPRVLDGDELTAFLAQRLARYKTPRLFRQIETLPKGANGKILRRALRETFEDR